MVMQIQIPIPIPTVKEDRIEEGTMTPTITTIITVPVDPTKGIAAGVVVVDMDIDPTRNNNEEGLHTIDMEDIHIHIHIHTVARLEKDT